jgi:hypothetical protein
MLLKYESLVDDFYREFKNINHFVGLSESAKVVAWFRENMQGEYNGEWGTTRNSTQVAHQWKSKMSGKDVDSVTNWCGIALRHLGFQHISQ